MSVQPAPEPAYPPAPPLDAQPPPPGYQPPPPGYPGMQPAGYPGMQPAGYPGMQPVGYPGMQPVGYPIAQPGVVMVGQPTHTTIVMTRRRNRRVVPTICEHCGGLLWNVPTVLGCLLAILFFPFGVFCCALMMDRKCRDCGKVACKATGV